MQFIDLQAQRRRIEPQINAAVQSVIESGRYVLGPEVGELEKQLAAWCGAKHAVSCANGTDALALALMAWALKPGDAVFGAGRGAFAEYVLASQDKVVLKPARLTFEQAAAVPIAALTALQGLRDKGRIQAGQKVLINGASGGVGTFAVHIDIVS